MVKCKFKQSKVNFTLQTWQIVSCFCVDKGTTFYIADDQLWLANIQYLVKASTSIDIILKAREDVLTQHVYTFM